MNNLPSLAPITDPNAGPTPSAHSTSLAALDPSRVQSSNSPSGLSALLGSIASSSGVGLLGGLLSSGLGLIGDAINYKRQNKLYDKQRNNALADYERLRSDYLSDLASERAYNSPAAQVARLKAAGINPNTVFGSGSVANTSSDAQNQAGFRGSAAPGPVNSGLGSAFAQGFTSASSGQIQSSSLDVQAQIAKSNIELQKSQMLKMLSEIRGIDENTKARAIENGWLDMVFQSDIDKVNAETSKIIDSMLTQELERDLMSYDLKEMKPALKQQIIAATEKLRAEYQSIRQQYAYFKSIKGYKIKSESEDLLFKQLNNAYQEYENTIKSFQVPKGLYDGLLQGALWRGRLLSSAIPFGFNKK